MPMLVPTRPDSFSAAENRAVWEILKRWDKLFLIAFGDRDPITCGADWKLHKWIPGCAGQPHVIIRGAGYFLQEDAGEELAAIVARFCGA